MDLLLTDTPTTIKILTSLLLILAAMKIIKSMFLSVATGSFLLALWLGHGFEKILILSKNTFLSSETLLLVFLVYIVTCLSSQMNASGILTDLISLIRKNFSKKFAIAILPAIIGLLPMPGGALFSAPLVKTCDEDESINPIIKSRINFWFRHVWELWWPLYPGVILAVAITNINLNKFILIHFPLSLVSILAGYFFLLRKIKNEENFILKNLNKFFLLSLLKLLSPITIIISTYLLITFFLPFIGESNKYYPMSIGVVFAIIILQFQRALNLKTWIKILLSPKTISICIFIFFIRIYGDIIGNPLPNGSLLFKEVHMELIRWGVPFTLIFALIPFISGLTIGLAVGFVGTSFPIVMALLGESYSEATLFSTILLAYGFGYIGMMLSPVHICLVVTNNFFKTSITRSIRGLLPPAITLGIGVLIMYSLIKMFG
jgi:uncharacterized protein